MHKTTDTIILNLDKNQSIKIAEVIRNDIGRISMNKTNEVDLQQKTLNMIRTVVSITYSLTENQKIYSLNQKLDNVNTLVKIEVILMEYNELYDYTDISVNSNEEEIKEFNHALNNFFDSLIDKMEMPKATKDSVINWMIDIPRKVISKINMS
ncbi:MAG: hypothetical protein ACFFG0_44160 [Candidatus Thorarchaeota archaeon]